MKIGEVKPMHHVRTYMEFLNSSSGVAKFGAVDIKRKIVG
jgi:hypothetical protein